MRRSNESGYRHEEEAMKANARQAPESVLLTVMEAAALLRIGRTKAYTMARTGKLPVVNVDGSVRVRKAELLRMLAQHAEGR